MIQCFSTTTIENARDMGLLCVPEGGGYYDWDLTYIIDGQRVPLLPCLLWLTRLVFRYDDS